MRALGAVCFVMSVCNAGCGEDVGGEDPGSAGEDTAKQTEDEGSTGSDEGDGNIEDDGTDACMALFGRPTANTGLGDEQCRPACDCGGVSFEAPVYEEHEIANLKEMELLNPSEPLDRDPYDYPEGHPLEPEKVCGVVFDEGDPGAYRLETFGDADAANEAGATVTHTGACGLCSSLANLAVYIENNDLAGPVRRCGLESTLGGAKKNIECLKKIGFDEPCAQIWYYNTKHTRESCLSLCLAALNRPYHKKDGSLNDCIQCDEDKSGQVFKAVSGRTRRNSGLPTALCRPCDSVAPIVHRY